MPRTPQTDARHARYRHYRDSRDAPSLRADAVAAAAALVAGARTAASRLLLGGGVGGNSSSSSSSSNLSAPTNVSTASGRDGGAERRNLPALLRAVSASSCTADKAEPEVQVETRLGVGNAKDAELNGFLLAHFRVCVSERRQPRSRYSAHRRRNHHLLW